MNTLKVQKRTKDEKPKRLRREGFITGNLFGKKIDGSIMLKFDRQEAEKALKGCVKGSQINLDLEGKKYDVLIKEIGYDAIKRQTLEIDFQALVSTEKSRTTAEIILTNKDKIKAGVLDQSLSEISYTALPKDMVDKVEYDVSTMQPGDEIKVSDLSIASNKKISLQTSLDTVVATLFVPHASATTETETEETAETSEE
ncbi:MAG: 50S ribosomal protein L25 [Pseudobutyrivibrio sp.]|nr:50S ribosomal protein L25 [Pseudobutyrivibrio sp.]